MQHYSAIQRLVLVVLVSVMAVSSRAALADPKEEIAFARSVVKAKLESERTGTGIEWTNPETGQNGRMTIVETQILDRNLPCRWYEWSVEYKSGSTIETEGKGCRMHNGEWLLEETAVVRERKEVRVEVPVEVERPAPEPKDPMAEVAFTRPDSMADTSLPTETKPVGGAATGGSQQEE
jgi:surface antigen